MTRKKWLLLAILSAFALFLASCSGGSGLPKTPGEYDVQAKSVSYDGREYAFHWIDRNKTIQRARVENLKMVQDSRTYLEMQGNEPVLHLSQDDPITVEGEDRQGGFSTFWFPFMLGSVLGSGGPVINQPYPGTSQTSRGTPTYHYPPSGDFGRDDTLSGSVTNTKPAPPDYSKVTPAPNAVSGKSAGTGAGAAATDKSGAVSGQSGGAGAGAAATNKGGFKSGTSSYSSKSSGGSSPKVGGGSGMSTGGKSSGGRSSGGRAGGGGRGGGK